ncbi:hypothetical protein [Streptomyces flaveus]|uniref:Uncharacterized protein n=1 Tax=Streptomyces flaveus TaxID=66370 RepID=A0A917R8G3_9ACTN|nr:hypothetical protein GCM10010094_64290 [Streptomyces flaveus]
MVAALAALRSVETTTDKADSAKVGDQFAAQSGGKHWIKYVYDDLAGLAGGSGRI